MRTQILIDIFPTSDVGECKFINCETNVGFLASILFKNNPSFKEISQCNSDCPPRLKNLPIIQIDESRIARREDFNKIVKESVLLEGEHPCCSQYCNGFEKVTLSETGKYSGLPYNAFPYNAERILHVVHCNLNGTISEYK